MNDLSSAFQAPRGARAHLIRISIQLCGDTQA
jgi:hypothetical protein